jgi:hypothetical protein
MKKMKHNLTYRQWMAEVEAKVEKRTGLGFDLLPDWMSRDSYEDGLTVQEGVDACLEQVGFHEYEERQLVDEL